MNIEKLEITIVASGKKEKKQVSWLLSDRADWYNDAAPFLITDSKVGDKLYGELSEKPIKVRMLSKYPYLKSRIEDYEEEQREADSTTPIGNDESTETEETETTDKGGVDADFVAFEDMSAEALVEHLNDNGIKFDKRKKNNREYLINLANK